VTQLDKLDIRRAGLAVLGIWLFAVVFAVLTLDTDSESPAEVAAEPTAPVAGPAPSSTPRTTGTNTPSLSTPTPTPTTTPAGALVIGNTGGDGVLIRTDCQDEAVAGTGWTEGQSVDLVEEGSDRCTGWSLVEASGVRSWVRDGYLSR